MELLDRLLVVPGFVRMAAEHVLGALDQALLPVLNLVGMYVELFGELSEGVLALHGSQSDLRLEGR